MKHCPACNFTFPETHRVCDFDGTELLKDESRALVRVETSPRPARLRLLVTSPGLLTGLAIIALFLSAVLIGSYKSTDEIPPVVKDQAAPTSFLIARTSELSSDRAKTPVEPNRRSATGAQASRVQSSVTGAQTSRLQINRTGAQASRVPMNTTEAQASRLQMNSTGAQASRLQMKSLGDRSVSVPRASIPSRVVVANGSRRSEIARGDNRDARAGERQSVKTSEGKDPKLVAILKGTWSVLKKPFKF